MTGYGKANIATIVRIMYIMTNIGYLIRGAPKIKPPNVFSLALLDLGVA
jgi:hypothetical protein